MGPPDFSRDPKYLEPHQVGDWARPWCPAVIDGHYCGLQINYIEGKAEYYGWVWEHPKGVCGVAKIKLLEETRVWVTFHAVELGKAYADIYLVAGPHPEKPYPWPSMEP